MSLLALVAACSNGSGSGLDAGLTPTAEVRDAQPVTDYFPTKPLCEREVAHPPISGDGLCSAQFPAADAPALDLDEVNLTLRIGGARVVVFDRVTDESACDDLQAWYYDDPQNPSQLLLCPEACSLAGSDPDSQVQLLTGCDTRCAPTGTSCAPPAKARVATW